MLVIFVESACLAATYTLARFGECANGSIARTATILCLAWIDGLAAIAFRCIN
jgi:dolichol kinase